MRVNGQHGMKTRLGLATAMVFCAGCRGKQTAGGTLPTVSPQSVALPGAVNAADAPNAPSVAESQAANLVRYQDAAHGVSFQYPASWRPPQQGTTGPGTTPPAFADAGPKPLMTQVFLPSGTPYAQTVLDAASFSYSVQAHTTGESCAALPGRALGGSARSREAVYNLVPYSEAQGGDAAACHQRRAVVDSTLVGSACFVFERDMLTTCPYVKTPTEPRPLRPSEQQALQQSLDAVMQSVRLEDRAR